MILALGLFNMVMVLFQLSTGLHWIKVPFRLHKKTGAILFVSAALHGILALIENYF
jgi:hypothetical protein